MSHFLLTIHHNLTNKKKKKKKKNKQTCFKSLDHLKALPKEREREKGKYARWGTVFHNHCYYLIEMKEKQSVY